jgi:hypothetical protein
MLVLIIKGNLNMGFGKLNLDFFMKRVVLLRFVKDCYIKVLNAEDLFPGSVFLLQGTYTVRSKWNRCQRHFKSDAVVQR